MSLTLLIAGGNGFLGRLVSKYFLNRGWRVVVLTRGISVRKMPIKQIQWDGRSPGEWFAEIDRVDVVLNLAGRSVNCRYNAINRREIELSRTQSTRILGEAISQARTPPKLWLNSSTATIYRHAVDFAQTDSAGEIGSGFSVGVARAWEEAFFSFATPKTRKLALRSAMVMGPGAGGPFNVFYNLARFGLGGAMGTGRQRVSWIHDLDFCRAISHLIDNEAIDGRINLSAPTSPTNDQFMRTLRAAIGMRIGLPATQWMIKVGTFLMRTESELPLKSRWVFPERLLEVGFAFDFADWSRAAGDLVARSRA